VSTDDRGGYDHDGDGVEWDRRDIYQYVRRLLVANQGHEGPHAPVADLRRVRRCACDTGALAVSQYETALDALGERDGVVLGDRYAGAFGSVSDGVVRAAVAWVAERDDADREFIAAANGVLGS